MFDRRTKNVEIFRDTCQAIKESKTLQNAVTNSIKEQKLFIEGKDCNYDIKNLKRDAMCRVVVSGKRTFEAAEPYAKDEKRVAVLNFASATNPGGGVIKGSSAQEEALCRCSTLYPCLNIEMMWEQFYGPHREADNPVYNNDILLTPDVMVFKSDIKFPERISEKDWYKVDVITCAAPNLRHVPSNAMNPNAGSKAANLKWNAYTELMRDRVNQIFKVALTTGADVLILGAFGCGAFCNPPDVVANLFKEATDKYGNWFETIEFAVFHTDREVANYDAFRKTFGVTI